LIRERGRVRVEKVVGGPGFEPGASRFRTLRTLVQKWGKTEIALHNGDAGLRIAMWSHNDPMTVFGAALNVYGWTEIAPIFERLGSSLSNCTSYENEVVAAGASGDLAYIVAFEHTTASLNGEPPQPYVLRLTTVFRREDGEWKAVHRHADPVSATAQERKVQLQKLFADVRVESTDKISPIFRIPKRVRVVYGVVDPNLYNSNARDIRGRALRGQQIKVRPEKKPRAQFVEAHAGG